MQHQELPLISEGEPLTPHTIENGQVYVKSYGRLFMQPILHRTNQTSLLADTVLGIAASASDWVDQQFESKESLPFLIPTYLFIVLLYPMIHIVFQRQKHPSLIELKMSAEDRLLMNNVSAAIQNQAAAIKHERLKNKERVELAVSLPTFLLSLSLHITYCVLLANQKDEKAQVNFFVENFDWLAPALICGMMMGLSLLGKKCYRDRAEKHFEAQLGLR